MCGPCGWMNRGGRPAREYGWKHAPKGRVYGRGVVYELPEGLDSPAAWLKALGEKPSKDEKANSKRLAELIEANSERLALPPAALVSAGEPLPGDQSDANLLNVLTVLAKSSGSLYLRDKVANVQSIGRVRRIVLVLPPNWQSQQVEQEQRGAA